MVSSVTAPEKSLALSHCTFPPASTCEYQPEPSDGLVAIRYRVICTVLPLPASIPAQSPEVSGPSHHVEKSRSNAFEIVFPLLPKLPEVPITVPIQTTSPVCGIANGAAMIAKSMALFIDYWYEITVVRATPAAPRGSVYTTILVGVRNGLVSLKSCT